MASPGRLGRLAPILALVVAVAGAAGLIGWLFARATEDSETVTVTVPAQQQAGERPAEERPAEEGEPGKVAYLAAGCDSCHGQDGEGTDVGPALPGHNAAQVRQQIRSPLGQMPAYPPQQLSDEEVDQITGYIAGLESTEEHVEPVKLAEVVAIHHWMALSAIAADDRNDAIHHVGHIIEGVRGEHREAMLEARTHLRAGDLHDAEHVLEEMLAGKAKPELTRAQLSLRLALTAVDRRDRREAIHQMRHFLQRAKGSNREKGEAALSHLRERDFHGAEHGIADLLGVERD